MGHEMNSLLDAAFAQILTKSNTPIAPAEPLHAIEQNVESPTEKSVRLCDHCSTEILSEHDVLSRACGHQFHYSCVQVLHRSGRTWCSECPKPTSAATASRSGYLVDSGTDLVVRSLVLKELDYNRSCVRIELSAANAYPTDSANHAGGNGYTASLSTVPAEPGGIPPPLLFTDRVKSAFGRWAGNPVATTSQSICSNERCGGQRYCLHHWDVSSSAKAVHAWRLYTLPRPLNSAANVRGAREALAALLDAHASPEDLFRCGATAHVLALLGVTIMHLVVHCKYELADLISGLQLTWDSLLVLGFHPSLLSLNHCFPVSVLVRSPIDLCAERLLSFQISYLTLVDRLGLTQEELYVLGFDAALFRAIGMTGIQLSAAVMQPEVKRHGGVAWWVRNFRLNTTLLKRFPIKSVDFQTIPSVRNAYFEMGTATLGQELEQRA